MRKNQIQYILSLLLFIFLLGFVFFHSTKGIDISESGYYISSALRYVLGDKPFRDEIISALHPFDMLFSFIFKIYPDISLLEIRYLGIILHFLAVLAVFFLLRNYAPPLLIALLCAVMFLMNSCFGIKIPSYNSLSSYFSVIALVFLLFSFLKRKIFYSLLFAFLAGLFFALAVFSYPPLGLLIIVPSLTLLIGFRYPERYKNYTKSSALFIGTFCLCFLVIFFIFIFSGLVPYFLEAFSYVRSSPFSKTHYSCSLNKIFGVWKEFYYLVVSRGIGLLAIVLLPSLFVFIPLKNRKSYYLLALIFIVSISFICLGIPWFLTRHIPIYPSVLAGHSNFANIVVVAFSVILGILMLFIINFTSYYKETDFKKLTNLLILWSTISAFTYSIFSGNSFRASSHGGLPLFVIGIIALYRIIQDYAINRRVEGIRLILWQRLYYLIVGVFLIVGISHYYKFIYREEKIDKLTARFTHPKLKGIYSTPKKVTAIERLLDYLKDKVKPKDYLLAYNSLGLLNYLTHTRPSYSLSYVEDWWLPFPIRQRLLDRMVNSNRLPDYAVRVLVIPEYDWSVLYVYKDSLINKFVQENYYLEKIIYPFEIWHRGKKPKLWIFKQMRPAFEDRFLGCKTFTAIDIKDISKIAPPLLLFEKEGDFEFLCFREENTNLIKIMPKKENFDSGQEVEFGYLVGENGLDLEIQPNDDIILLATVRIFKEEDKYPYYRAELFIEDEVQNEVERNSVPIINNFWDDYIVEKKIRPETERITFGIKWLPKDKDDFLEIRDIRLLIMKSE